jgi:hypothetical protein
MTKTKEIKASLNTKYKIDMFLGGIWLWSKNGKLIKYYL